jgi:DNA-directed RNA polymerase subunit K
MQEQLARRLTKYERTQVVGMRAEQLARGAQPFVDVSVANNTAPDGGASVYYDIAERELEAHRLPFVVVRKLPDGKTERLRIGGGKPPP